MLDSTPAEDASNVQTELLTESDLTGSFTPVSYTHLDVYKRQGLQTDQNDLLHLAGLDHFLCLFSSKDDLAAGRTGRSCQALADDLCSLQGCLLYTSWSINSGARQAPCTSTV